MGQNIQPKNKTQQLAQQDYYGPRRMRGLHEPTPAERRVPHFSGKHFSARLK
jgi:hypothetical protein